MRETEGFIYKVFKWYSEFNGQEEPPPAPIWRYYLCSTSSSTSGQACEDRILLVLNSTVPDAARSSSTHVNSGASS
ncbi:uncharacterized protein LOC122289633 isoform X3 [Carya illinoinensis]|uniref:uncharacterized protein LOC122289633 isoform X3 n=1 Tax=Carya illinoinensis TaxID=32201 RepID=UPI001C723071|nr:uncharacterized protein LOC122289633 isoform X3 [Carya illinoinensis]